MLLTKYSASGNDFLITTAFRRANRVSLAQKLCNRHNGIGADGLVVLLPHNRFAYKWEFYNADGSKADMCGNASRCVAHYAYANKIAPKNHSFLSSAGEIKVRVAGSEVEVNLGKVRILRENITESLANSACSDFLRFHESRSLQRTPSASHSLDSQKRKNSSTILEFASSVKNSKSIVDLSPQDEFALNFTLLDSGVPHLVAFVPNLNSAQNLAFLKNLRDKYNANVNLAFIADRDTIEILTYERGVENITLACGTGMCAVYYLAKMQNLINDKATLIPPSGDKIALRLENNEVCFKGKVIKIADIIV